MNATGLVVVVVIVVLPFALLAWSEAVGSAVLRAADAVRDQREQAVAQAVRFNRRPGAVERRIRMDVDPPGRGERALYIAARLVAARRGLPAPAPRIEGGW